MIGGFTQKEEKTLLTLPSFSLPPLSLSSSLPPFLSSSLSPFPSLFSLREEHTSSLPLSPDTPGATQISLPSGQGREAAPSGGQRTAGEATLTQHHIRSLLGYRWGQDYVVSLSLSSPIVTNNCQIVCQTLHHHDRCVAETYMYL